MLKKISLILCLIITSLTYGQTSIAKTLKSMSVDGNNCSSIGGTQSTNATELKIDYEMQVSSSKKFFAVQLKTNVSIPDKSVIADELIQIETGGDKFALRGISAKGKVFNGGCEKTHTNAKELRFVIEYIGGDYVLDQTETATFTIASILTDAKIIEATDATSINRTLTMTITIKEDEAASIDALEQYGFSFGPNPSADFLQLNASSSIETVSVKNLMGQTLINDVVASKNSSLDVSTLNAGIYIIEVAINGAKGSFQFVKN